MSDQARLFDGSGPLVPIPDGIRPRQVAWYRGANRRLGAMHGKHGHGSEGQTCGECAHLVRKWNGGPGRGAFLKCELYNVDGFEGTDWRAKWPACGAIAPRGAERGVAGRSHNVSRPTLSQEAGHNRSEAGK